MNAREEMLARVRSAIGDEPTPKPVARNYRTLEARPAGDTELVDLFEDRLVDYRATVVRTTGPDLAASVGTVLAERVGASYRLAVPAGIDRSWAAGATVLLDDPPLTSAQLDQADAVLTGCAIAIAETGTIVLDASADQGRRALSLVPDLHVCVVRREQIVDNVPAALRLLDPARPLTFISGGSATSDIELQRVEGVHGPRQLVVLIVA